MAAKLVTVKNFIIGGLGLRASASEGPEQVQNDNSDVKILVGASGSEDEEEEEDDFDMRISVASKRGTLTKWTNYLHGWQDRYFVIADGILSYYKSEFDTNYGCRGSVSIQKATILLHEFDDLRFDVRVHDCTYFLRASTAEDKQGWIDTIEANKKWLLENGFDSNSMRRQGSILSLSQLSIASSSSLKRSHDLQEKLAELETFRDILCRQLDNLQPYFEASGGEQLTVNSNSTSSLGEGDSSNAHNSGDEDSERPTTNHLEHSQSSNNVGEDSPPAMKTGVVHTVIPTHIQSRQGHRRTGSDPNYAGQFYKMGRHSLQQNFHRTHNGNSFVGTSTPTSPTSSRHEFRGEVATFKATSAGIIATLNYCIEFMTKKEEHWQRKFEKEQERRHKAEIAAHAAMNGPRSRAYKYAGPDFEEGPHSIMNEEEFYDALEIAYHDDELLADNPLSAVPLVSVSPMTPNENIPAKIEHESFSGKTHRLTPLVNEKIEEYSKYLFEPVDIHWSMVYEDGDMTVYRRDLEEGGVVVDPLKAQHTVQGISAFEVIKNFFYEETRMEWEGTLESVKQVEMLAEDTYIFHQMHKRVWPSTQRETLFASHLCSLTNAPRPDNMVGRTWMVCNFSINRDDIPITNNFIRATLYVGMVCQTIANRPIEKGQESELTRDDVSCRIIYAANVNPGGWAPPTVVRTIAKRELTKFLRTFSTFASKSTMNTPLTL